MKRLTRGGVCWCRLSCAHKLDGDQWFLLNRLDRQDDDPKPGRLTSDVIVWGPTREHVDVLSSSGGMWSEHPPISDSDWKLEHFSNWPSWDDVNPSPGPRPDPEHPSIPVPPDLEGKLNRILELLTDIRVHFR